MRRVRCERSLRGVKGVRGERFGARARAGNDLLVDGCEACEACEACEGRAVRFG